jgi:hypothetical protein
MNYYVELYKHPSIVVRSAKTGLAHEFIIAKDGVLYHDKAQIDFFDARNAAIAYLAHRRCISQDLI